MSKLTIDWAGQNNSISVVIEFLIGAKAGLLKVKQKTI